MAWTAPRTWVTSEVVSAAIMNTHVRDELLETAPSKASAAGQQPWSTAVNAIAMVTAGKYKSADESVNNSTTLQNDDHLAFSIAANEVWAFRAFLYFTIASGNPGIKWTFTVPASCTGFYTAIDGPQNIDSAAAIAAELTNIAIATTRAWGITGVTSDLVIFDGVIINGANAGTIQFQWAQNSAVASNLTLKAGSYLDLKRLA